MWSGSREGQDIVPIKSSHNSAAISSFIVPGKFQLLVVIEGVTEVEARFKGFPNYFLSLGHYLAIEGRFILDISVMLKSPLTSHLQCEGSLIDSSCHSVILSLESLGAYIFRMPKSPPGRPLS